MTLIWATQVHKKWTLLADSGVTIGQTMTDANRSYRPKIREIVGKNVTIYVASCGTIKDIDFLLNIIEEKLAKTKIKDINSLKYFLQNTLAEGQKELKTLTNDPSAAFLFLVPDKNVLFIADEYAVTEAWQDVSIAFGSADQNFYKVNKMEDFFTSFKWCVACDEFCGFPIISFRDWKVNTWTEWDNVETFYKSNEDGYDRTEVECCIPVPEYREPTYISRSTNEDL